MRPALQCCRVCFLRWKESVRIPFLFLILITIVGGHAADIIRYEANRNFRCTAWLAPYLFSSPLVLLATTLVIVAIFAELPGERYPALQFLLVRSGRRAWFLGSILYAFSTSALLSVLVCAIPLIMGKLDYSITFRSSIFTHIAHLTPLEAEIVAFLAFWALFFWVGVLIACLNICFRGKTGVFVASSLCFLSYLIGIFPPFPRIQYVSPISWLSINDWNWDKSGASFPSPGYIFGFLCITGLLFCFAAFLWLRRGELKAGDHL